MKEEIQSNFFERTFYHGSRGGIEGPIRPISRPKCDFGIGFYMGSNPMQAQALICMDQDPCIYSIKIDSNKVDTRNCYFLTGKEWMYAVLAFRNRLPEFTELSEVQRLLNNLSRYDFLIGPIADDRMGPAIKEFENGSLTDKGLMHCLMSVNYGGQIVAKTPKACEAIHIIRSHELSNEEIDSARMYADQKRSEGGNIIEQAKRLYAREGMYYYELIDSISKTADIRGEIDDLDNDLQNDVPPFKCGEER